ncbi:MAG: hypothetical protein AVO33_08950 [delta proteobacterium ML8_F1]|nr:MAG: hypothetical protein AVO33_08950 [delta proteobacterium ML8_F1]
MYEKRIESMGYHLPPMPAPAARYLPAARTGNLIFISGQTPKVGDKLVYAGKLGQDLSAAEGYEASKICILRVLSALKAEVGDLDQVIRIVKLTGYVNSAPDFTKQSKVIDGASELLEVVFGEQGRHARVAVGTNALPGNAAVEIELIVEVRGE